MTKQFLRQYTILDKFVFAGRGGEEEAGGKDIKTSDLSLQLTERERKKDRTVKTD